MKKLTTLSLILTGFLFALSAEARNLERRQHRQSARIKQGVKSGQLTREEARDLRQEKRENRKDIHEYRKDRKEALSDGKIDPSERKELLQERREITKQQNELSKDIYQEKHDEQVRPRAEAPAEAPAESTEPPQE